MMPAQPQTNPEQYSKPAQPVTQGKAQARLVTDILQAIKRQTSPVNHGSTAVPARAIINNAGPTLR